MECLFENVRVFRRSFWPWSPGLYQRSGFTRGSYWIRSTKYVLLIVVTGNLLKVSVSSDVTTHPGLDGMVIVETSDGAFFKIPHPDVRFPIHIETRSGSSAHPARPTNSCWLASWHHNTFPKLSSYLTSTVPLPDLRISSKESVNCVSWAAQPGQLLIEMKCSFWSY